MGCLPYLPLCQLNVVHINGERFICLLGVAPRGWTLVLHPLSPTASQNKKYFARILVIAESLTFCIGAEVEEWLVVAARTNSHLAWSKQISFGSIIFFGDR